MLIVRFWEHEQFISTYVEATLAAVRTHDQEKREALGNAVIHSALPNAPENAKQQLFIRWISELSPYHLRIMKYLQNPTLPKQIGRVRTMAGSIMAEMLSAIPELENHKERISLWTSELSGRQLISSGNLNAMMSASGLASKRTTLLGDEYLRFISEPE